MIEQMENLLTAAGFTHDTDAGYDYWRLKLPNNTTMLVGEAREMDAPQTDKIEIIIAPPPRNDAECYNTMLIGAPDIVLAPVGREVRRLPTQDQVYEILNRVGRTHDDDPVAAFYEEFNRRWGEDYQTMIWEEWNNEEEIDQFRESMRRLGVCALQMTSTWILMKM